MGGYRRRRRASEAARHRSARVRFGSVLGRSVLCPGDVGPVGAQSLAVGGVHDADPHTDTGHGWVIDAARLPSSRPRCRSRDLHGYVLPAEEVHQRRIDLTAYRAVVIAHIARVRAHMSQKDCRALACSWSVAVLSVGSIRVESADGRAAGGSNAMVPARASVRSRRPASFGDAHGADAGCPAPGPRRGTAFRVDGSTQAKLRRPSLVIRCLMHAHRQFTLSAA
jgi:hypothetical protein